MCERVDSGGIVRDGTCGIARSNRAQNTCRDEKEQDEFSTVGGNIPIERKLAQTPGVEDAMLDDVPQMGSLLESTMECNLQLAF